MIARLLGWTVFTLAVAAGVHVAAVAYAPQFIMWRAMAATVGKGTNTITHGERATAAARRIVKPSPDLLYSTCVYDVSRNPVKITTAAPTDTYWSVAFYAANTDNFFVLNDKQTEGKPASIVLVGKGQVVPPQPEGTITVSAPTTTGIALFRTLVNDDVREPELDRQRRAADCAPLR